MTGTKNEGRGSGGEDADNHVRKGGIEVFNDYGFPHLLSCGLKLSCQHWVVVGVGTVQMTEKPAGIKQSWQLHE